ncbi:MAG TPA: phage tail sheath C-terminal domain-containing protein [Caulobacteraceae bacterium]
MAVAVTYPGVYIQELPSGVHTITGVATSIGAFVDAFTAGPMNKATQVLSFADFERQFGGLAPGSEASYAIQQFFLNGGAEAYVVRVTAAGAGATSATAAAITLEDKATGGSAVLTATASSPGGWGDNVRVDVDYLATDAATQFNLTVTEVDSTGAVSATEVFRNLVIDPSKSNDALTTVNATSQLIILSAGAAGKRPAQTGQVSAAVPDYNALGVKFGDVITVNLNGNKVKEVGPLAAKAADAPADLPSLAALLQSLIRAADPSVAKATVSIVGNPPYLVAKPGTANPHDIISFTDANAGGLASKLGFDATAANVQLYALGGTAAGAASTPTSGANGSWDPTQTPGQWSSQTGIALGLIGDEAAKTGMHALLDVDLFNILCIPATLNLGDGDAAAVADAASTLCETRRAMYVLDPPSSAADTVPGITTWLGSHSGLRSPNAALYFPRLDIPDPTNQLRPRKVAPSGTVAGLWARTDGSRGVWKAPAGTTATLSNVQKLEYTLTDPENGVLNPLAINCLRNFPIYGPVCWGARTLNGADQMADQWKYIPVRRLALYIEESLYRGTQWVVFEPNDEPLWAQIRLNVGAFMQSLFRQGAFQGTTPQQAYFVTCDATTNPQVSINQGIVNIVVGFAPLLPAEFVIISIQQMAGQLAT